MGFLLFSYQSGMHVASQPHKIGKSANEKRRSHQAMREVSSNDHRLVTRYLAGAVIQLCHFQRPGVAANMTVKEFAIAMQVGDDGERLIAVTKHKTATSYPACMILSAADFQLWGGLPGVHQR